ncbi:MAG: RNA 2',3'-cyclic phosphodiesterase [Caldiserica bacterium]|jgi:2'-5' RNA ligase|nr:RNA 2',3'-cyclic phosphodiesterase [Caldisericota bacterium]MDH7562342.1 RNA 2',3'-cyclic phosphodiesterase [Caldisericota bacterium]
MRVFVALPIPEEVKQTIGVFMGKLRSSGADVKWVERENLHFTLRFLGELEEGDLPRVEDSIKTLSGFKSFQAKTGPFGVFPSLSSPRVFWIGLEKGKEEMEEISRALNLAFKERGFPQEDKPFQAHLTIGRARSPKNIPALKQLLETLSPPQVEFSVAEVSLFQSTLTPRGPIYRKLFRQPLS